MFSFQSISVLVDSCRGICPVATFSQCAPVRTLIVIGHRSSRSSQCREIWRRGVKGSLAAELCKGNICWVPRFDDFGALYKGCLCRSDQIYWMKTFCCPTPRFCFKLPDIQIEGLLYFVCCLRRQGTVPWVPVNHSNQFAGTFRMTCGVMWSLESRIIY